MPKERVRLPPTTPIHTSATDAGEVLKARTLGPYPRSSGFDPRRRPHHDEHHLVSKL
jgi:hypothetical protein